MKELLVKGNEISKRDLNTVDTFVNRVKEIIAKTGSSIEDTCKELVNNQTDTSLFRDILDLLWKTDYELSTDEWEICFYTKYYMGYRLVE